jgi:hypothetical protein
MYAIRVCGSNDYVSKIDKNDKRCWPPGSVDYVPSFKVWAIKKFPTQLGAERAAKLVGKIDGVHCDVENLG